MERHYPSFSNVKKCICGLPMKGHPPRAMPEPTPDYGQPWKAVQPTKGGTWAIINSVDRVVATGIGSHAEAEFIVSTVNGK